MKILHRSYWIWIIGYNLLSVCTAWAQSTIVTGHEPQYAGKRMTFYTLNDRIINSRQVLGECTADSSGFFQVAFSHDHTIQVFADLGIFRTYLYAEPGNEYDVRLPPRLDKTTAEKLNPYFRLQEIHLGLINYDDEELNILIRRFDDQFNPLFEKYAVKAYLQTVFKDLEADLDQLNRRFINVNNPYFQCYKRYKFELLRSISSKHKSPGLRLPEYFPAEILYHNPAFMDWFNQVYRNYLEYLSKAGNVESIHGIINQEKSLHRLLNTLYRTEHVENTDIVEYIILKGLYDGYFSDEFNDSAILEILDSLRNYTGIQEHRLTIDNIINKLTRLRTGNSPPGFTLPSFDGPPITLEELKGKYVYLNFCSALSFHCLNQFDLLKSIYEKYFERLEVVTISVDEDNGRLKDMIGANDYNWIFLEARDQPDLINLYDVHAFPTYFLIDPEGKLVLSPAPGPGEDFERYYLEILESRNELSPHP